MFLKVDFENAFNSSRRDEMLKSVIKLAPSLLPYVHSSYSSSSLIFWGRKPWSKLHVCVTPDEKFSFNDNFPSINTDQISQDQPSKIVVHSQWLRIKDCCPKPVVKNLMSDSNDPVISAHDVYGKKSVQTIIHLYLLRSTHA